MKRIDALPKKNIIIVLFLLISLASCKIAYYPTSHNSPMLSNKSEFQFAGIIGAGNFELQSAYAITDNFGVMLNGSYADTKREIELNDETVEVTETHNLIEIGAGYFSKFGELTKFEVFAGGGKGMVPGNFRNVSYIYDGTQTETIKKFFIQPGIGLGSKVVDFSGVVRLSAVTINRETNYFIEPGLSMKIGYKTVRFVGNLGVSGAFIETGTLSWDHNPLIIGLGLQLNLGRKY